MSDEHSQIRDGTSTPQSKAPRETIRKRLNPYDLSSGDNPGATISQPQLRGPNYDEWAQNIRLALRARKKFGFADGSIPQPAADSEDLEDWWANNAMVVSWIKVTIAPDLSSSLSHHEIASDLWLHIQKRFSVKNGQRVQRIKTELATCQQKGLAVEAYYGKLTKLWTSLSDFQRAKTAEEIAKEREEDKLHQFLMGLDETVFGAVKSSLLSRDPLPSLDEAYQVVVQDEESKRGGRMLEDRNESVSFAVQTSSRPRNQSELRDPSAVCSLCGRNGHLAANCFRKIGYPTWWKDRPRSKLPSSHETSSAPSKQVEPARANHVTTSAPSFAAHAALTNADRVGLTGLDDKQWDCLIGMLKERNSSGNDRLSGPHHNDADWRR